MRARIVPLIARGGASPPRGNARPGRGLAGCAHHRHRGGHSRRPPSMSWPPRTSGAASPSSSAATKSQVTSIISNPNTDPHDYEPTVADARTFATADLVVYNGAGYDPWVQQLLEREPDPGAPRSSTSAICRRVGGRQSAPVVLAERRARPSRAGSRRTTRSSTPPTPPTTTSGGSEFETNVARPVRRADLPDREQITPARRSARRRASSRPLADGAAPQDADTSRLPERDQRGRRSVRGRQGHSSISRSRRKQIKIFIYNQQNSTPDVPRWSPRQRQPAFRWSPSPRRSSLPMRRSRSGRSPSSRRIDTALRQDDGKVEAWPSEPTSASCHMTLALAGGHASTAPVPAVVESTSPADRRAATTRRCVSASARCGAVSTCAGAWRVHGRAWPQRRGQDDAAARGARPAADLGGQVRVLGKRAGQANSPHRLPAAAPQLRRRACGSAASTSCGSASTATGGACRCRRPASSAAATPRRGRARPRDHRAGRRDAVTPSAPSARSPAASSSACSSLKRSCATPRCSCSTSRSTASTCRAKPRSPRSSATSRASRGSA